MGKLSWRKLKDWFIANRFKLGVVVSLVLFFSLLAYVPAWDSVEIPLVLMTVGLVVLIGGIALTWWPKGLLASAVVVLAVYLLLLLNQAADRLPRDNDSLILDSEIRLYVEYPMQLRLGEPQPVRLSLQRDRASTAISYQMVITTSSNVVAFTDQNGNPVPAEKTLSPGPDASVWTLYLSQMKEVTRGTTVVATVQPLLTKGASLPLTMRADAPFETAFRTIRQVLVSPLASLIALTGLAITGFVQERQRREEHRRKLQQDRDRLRGLPEQDRLEEYLNLELDLNKEDKDYLWTAVRFPGWEEVALKQMVDSWEQDRERADRWLGLADAKSPKHELVPILRQLVVGQTIKAGDALKIYQTLGGPGAPAEKVTLAQLQSASSEDLEKLADSPDARYLLRKLKPEKKSSFTGKLASRLKERADWPPIWLGKQSTQIANQALKELGFDQDPFGPENAESAALLPNVFVEPDFWDVFLSPAPLWTQGRSGSGHSVLALMLRFECSQLNPRQSVREVFPVHLSLNHFSTQSELANQILSGTVQALLRFLALNPYGFLALPSPRRCGMAELIRWKYPNTERLAQALRRIGADVERGSGKWMMDAVQTVMPPRDIEEEPGQWLRFATPEGYSRLYLVLETTGGFAGQAEILETWASHWSCFDVYLKILEKSLQCSSKETVNTCCLQVDLGEMLRRRIAAASNGRGYSLAIACELDVVDPDDLLVRAASDSPREMVRLGNQLLKKWAERTNGKDKISLDDFKRAGIVHE